MGEAGHLYGPRLETASSSSLVVVPGESLSVPTGGISWPQEGEPALPSAGQPFFIRAAVESYPGPVDLALTLETPEAGLQALAWPLVGGKACLEHKPCMDSSCLAQGRKADGAGVGGEGSHIHMLLTEYSFLLFVCSQGFLKTGLHWL